MTPAGRVVHELEGEALSAVTGHRWIEIVAEDDAEKLRRCRGRGTRRPGRRRTTSPRRPGSRPGPAPQPAGVVDLQRLVGGRRAPGTVSVGTTLSAIAASAAVVAAYWNQPARPLSKSSTIGRASGPLDDAAVTLSRSLTEQRLLIKAMARVSENRSEVFVLMRANLQSEKRLQGTDVFLTRGCKVGGCDRCRGPLTRQPATPQPRRRTNLIKVSFGLKRGGYGSCSFTAPIAMPLTMYREKMR